MPESAALSDVTQSNPDRVVHDTHGSDSAQSFRD